MVTMSNKEARKLLEMHQTCNLLSVILTSPGPDRLRLKIDMSN